MKTMENETTKAVWQKPDIIDLDLELTEKDEFQFEIGHPSAGPAPS
jgi:hypothetical protein